MFGFVKRIFVSTMICFGCSLSCVSMNNQEFEVRPEIVNVNSKEARYFLLVLE